MRGRFDFPWLEIGATLTVTLLLISAIGIRAADAVVSDRAARWQQGPAPLAGVPDRGLSDDGIAGFTYSECWEIVIAH